MNIRRLEMPKTMTKAELAAMPRDALVEMALVQQGLITSLTIHANFLVDKIEEVFAQVDRLIGKAS